MNKKIFFTLINFPKKLNGLSNKLCYKSNMHNLIFKSSTFINVRYQSSIITNCNFNCSKLFGVDFCNCNLKKSTFKNAILRNVCFFNCNVSETDFSNATFENVIFVCTRTQNAKHLVFDGNCKTYNSYEKVKLLSEDEDELLKLACNKTIYNSHILHVTKKKLNFWSLRILIDIFGYEAIKALCEINNVKTHDNFYTINSFSNYIENQLKIW